MATHGPIYIREGRDHATAGRIYHNSVTLFNNFLQSVGAFSSATVGYGVTLTRTSPYTAAHRIYADDKGAALYGSGSVPDIRGSLSRVLITANQTGGNIRLYGSQGQLKGYCATATPGAWNGEVAAGAYGYLELVRASGTMTFGGYGVSAGLMGTVTTSGTITVNTYHVIAGCAVISDFKATLTQTGKTAGFYVTKYDTTNWSDATARTTWGYGLLIADSSVATGLYIGACTTAINVSGNTGILLNAAPATTGGGLKIHTHANVNNSGGTYDLTYINEFKGEFVSTSGTMIGVGAIYALSGTGTGAMCSVLGDSTLTAGITLSGSAYPAVGVLTGGQFTVNVLGTLNGTAVLVTGLYGGVSASTGGTWTTARYVSAIWGDWKPDITLGTGDSHICLLTNSSATSTVDYGLRIINSSTGAITRAICVGTSSSTAGDGLKINNSTWINGFFSDDGGAAQTASTVCRNVLARTYISVSQTGFASDYDVIRGQLKSATTITFSGDTSVKTAIHGYCELAGQLTIGAGVFYTPIMGEIWSDGNIVNTAGSGAVGGVLSRLYTSAGSITAGTTFGAFVACKHFSSTNKWPYGFVVQAGAVTAGYDIQLQSGAVIGSGTDVPTHSAIQGSIYLRTGQGINATIYFNTNGSTGWTLADQID